MSVYMTEDEQMDAIKSWWKRYNSIIIVLFSLILLAISGVRYWNCHEEKVTQQASNTYEHLMMAFSNHDNKGVRGFAKQLTTEYGKTVYADAARLTLARLYVVNEKYPEARAQLEYVITHAKVNAMQQVARVRLARLLAADKSYPQALEELAEVDDAAYTPLVNELKGDIYAATGRYEQAFTFYRSATEEVQKKGMGNPFLEMKVNELAALTASLKNKA